MVEAGRVEEKLGALIGRIGSYFSRVEPVRQVRKYIRGLMSDLSRKNCWTLAEYAGDPTPDRMQRLLERASWNTLAVMRAVRDFVVEHLADPHAPAVLSVHSSCPTLPATLRANWWPWPWPPRGLGRNTA
jgi:SRSO17 transposase